MPEVEISIGGRYFEVACQEGEEHYLQAAAKLLDNEASALTEQMGRLSEGRLLLMAGLMLADKTSGLQDRMRGLQEKLDSQDQLLAEMRAGAEAGDPGERLSALANRAEAAASALEDIAT